MKRKYTTALQDAQFLALRTAAATKKWQPGDACLAYRGREVTSVARVEGDTVYLADGTHMHVSRMRFVTEAR